MEVKMRIYVVDIGREGYFFMIANSREEAVAKFNEVHSYNYNEYAERKIQEFNIETGFYYINYGNS